MHRFKIVICLLFWFSITAVYAQDYSSNWKGHFCYLDIQDLDESEDKLYAAATNAVFTYDFNSKEINTISTVNGLSGEDISALLYIENKSLVVIGYNDGLVQIFDEVEEEVISVVDILEKPTILSANKKINHFHQEDDLLYISTGFGISVFDLDRLEFNDTYFIGSNNSQINVNQSVVSEGFLYAASDFGIFRGDLSKPNLIDANEWENINSNNCIGVQDVGGNLYAALSNKDILEIVNGATVVKTSMPQAIFGFKSSSDQLVVTTLRGVSVFSSGLNQTVNIDVNPSEYSNLRTATIANNNEIYIGTKSTTSNEGLGVLKTTFSDPSAFEEIHPNGPLKNRFFKLDVNGSQLWGTHGGHNEILNFVNSKYRRIGLSHLENEQWDNIKYKRLSDMTPNPTSAAGVVINPLNPNQVFVTIYGRGLLEITDKEVTSFFNGNNSTLSPFAASFSLTSTALFDDSGDLWVMNGRVDRPLNIFSNNNWISERIPIIPSPQDENGFYEAVFDRDDNLFIGSYRFGLIGLKRDGSNSVYKYINDEEDGMPSQIVNTLAIDQNNQLWFGTDRGLRVIYNTSEFIEGEPKAENIIIKDGGEARELFFQLFISDIKVDGSNNKWVGTISSGLYYVSSDGQETVFHFTKDNSPLPSNDILDIAIDEENGIVYIATEKGMVSFQSGATKPEESLENAFAFPNPVRPGFDLLEEKLKIRNLSDNVNIKILDIEGNLVAEAASRTNLRFKNNNLEVDGGTAFWNGKNLAGVNAASGVYLVMLNDLDTFETKVLKVMLVR